MRGRRALISPIGRIFYEIEIFVVLVILVR